MNTDKVYLQLSLPNILTIGVIVVLVYTFAGTVYSFVGGYLPTRPAGT